MRIILLILAFTGFVSVSAQTPLPVSGISYRPQIPFTHHSLQADSNSLQKKWFVSTYAGIGAGIGFFNGGNAAFLPAEIGIQLNRRLNNNLYAFTGVTASPAFFSFNRFMSSTDVNKNYMAAPGFDMNRLGIYTGIQAGLMYVNDEKTFSISGSIGVGRTSYPFSPSNRIKSSFTNVRQ